MAWTTRTPEERFESNVDRSGECWEWRGSLADGGYGVIRVNGTRMKAHRYSFEQVNGPIPDGLCVCHRCDNRKCVRPSHLFLGTLAENLEDMTAKGRRTCGEQTRHAKLNVEKITAIRNRLSSGDLQRIIAADFGVTQATISKLARGVRWRHLGLGKVG